MVLFLRAIGLFLTKRERKDQRRLLFLTILGLILNKKRRIDQETVLFTAKDGPIIGEKVKEDQEAGENVLEIGLSWDILRCSDQKGRNKH